MNRSLLNQREAHLWFRSLLFTATRAANAGPATSPQHHRKWPELYEDFSSPEHRRYHPCCRKSWFPSLSSRREALRKLGVTVTTGVFQARMSVELVNEGPVTILIDSDKTF